MFKKLFAKLKAHFTRAEIRSIFQTFIATAGVEAVTQFNVFLEHFDRAAAIALVAALLRSLLKSIWIVESRTITTINQVTTPTETTTKIVKTESTPEGVKTTTQTTTE